MREGWKYALEGSIGLGFALFGIERDIPDCDYLATEIDELTVSWTKGNKWFRVALGAIGVIGRALSTDGDEAGHVEYLEQGDFDDQPDTGSEDLTGVITHEEE